MGPREPNVNWQLPCSTWYICDTETIFFIKCLLCFLTLPKFSGKELSTASIYRLGNPTQGRRVMPVALSHFQVENFVSHKCGLINSLNTIHSELEMCGLSCGFAVTVV